MFEAYYSQLNTPCLVVDEPMTRENIKRMQQVADALERLPESSSGVPTAVIADTVKGKNISFMEREIKWHAGSMNEADLQTALADLDAALDRQRKEL